jgi:hypothetical protein
MDESSQQCQNASCSSELILQFAPNSIQIIDVQQEKDIAPSLSISSGITTFESFPKYRMIRVPSNVKRKSLQTAKCEFPGSISILLTPSSKQIDPSTTSNDAGRMMDFSRQHRKNAKASISRNFEPESFFSLKCDRFQR